MNDFAYTREYEHEVPSFEYYFGNSEIKVKEEIDSETVNKAINLLFPVVSLNQRNSLNEFIQKMYSRIGCVVLYISERDRRLTEDGYRPFTELCRRLNINSEKREVIITPEKRLLYSSDYTKEPRQLPSTRRAW